jgi:hypothetical protein
VGLLAKTNPTSTKESVIQQAWIWGAVSVAACLAYFLWMQPDLPGWPILLPFAALAGAALGALMEWQLDDGLEIYYVVKEIEDEFAVKIPEWDQIETVDDLYRATITQLREANGNDVDEDDVWCRLKALLIQQLKFKPEKVVPEARFYINLPM